MKVATINAIKRVISSIVLVFTLFCCFTVVNADAVSGNWDDTSIGGINLDEIQSWSDLAEYYGDDNTRGLPTAPVWFRILRTGYAQYETHYTYNYGLEGNSMSYIMGQANCPQFNIGNSTMANVGCEIAATFNALKLRGWRVPCSSIIRCFEKKGYLMANGYLGSDPYAIGDYFSYNSMGYTKYTSYSSMKELVNSNRGSFNVFIVSFWNSSSIFDGLHTVAFYTSSADNNIRIYNFYNNSTTLTQKTSFESFVDSDKFIVGYQVARVRNNSDLEEP